MTDSRATLPLQNRSRRAELRAPAGTADPATRDSEGASLLVRWSAGSAVVVLSGELDMTCAQRLANAGRLLGEWAQPPVVDAAGVTFIDLAGLSALCSLSRTGEPVLVLQPSASLLRLLHVLALAGWGPSVQALGDREQGVVLLAPTPPGPAPA